jgi:hypothetical protein
MIKTEIDLELYPYKGKLCCCNKNNNIENPHFFLVNNKKYFVGVFLNFTKKCHIKIGKNMKKCGICYERLGNLNVHLNKQKLYDSLDSHNTNTFDWDNCKSCTGLQFTKNKQLHFICCSKCISTMSKYYGHIPLLQIEVFKKLIVKNNILKIQCKLLDVDFKKDLFVTFCEQKKGEKTNQDWIIKNEIIYPEKIIFAPLTGGIRHSVGPKCYQKKYNCVCCNEILGFDYFEIHYYIASENFFLRVHRKCLFELFKYDVPPLITTTADKQKADSINVLLGDDIYGKVENLDDWKNKKSKYWEFY